MWMYILAVPVVVVLYVAVRLLHARSVAKRDKWAQGPWLRFYWKWFSDTPSAKARRGEIPQDIRAYAIMLAIGAGILAFVSYSAWDMWTASDRARVEQWQAQVPPPLPPTATAAQQEQHAKALAEWLAKDPRITQAEETNK